MTNDQLDRLSKLASIYELCAKMGGTPMFIPIQQAISEDLKAFVDEMNAEEEEKKPVARAPKAIPAKTDDVTHIDRRV